MKKLLTTLLLFFLLKTSSFAQGRVLINEYMPWVTNDQSCPAQSEYVELYNFGPGPVNIGCYILTEGEYAVTIPPNTILQPGQFYLISGVDQISASCSKSGVNAKVDLNWNNGKSLNKLAITDKEGLFSDGGGSKDPVVLLDAQLNVVDAIAREIPSGRSPEITTSSYSSEGCGTQKFTLIHGNIPYETIDVANGRANSYARRINGGCEWVKNANLTPGASNGPGIPTFLSYDLTFTGAMDCNGNGGSVSINVTPSGAFPLDYILGYDGNDGQFSLEDTYINGTDNTPSRIDFNNLAAGSYRVTLSPAQGCDLRTIPFEILPCQPALPLQVLSFKHIKNQQSRLTFEWTVSEAETVQTMDLEQSSDNHSFTIASQPAISSNADGTQSFTTTVPTSEHKYYRLRITLKNGAIVYSSTINTNTSASIPVSRLWPNPTKDFLNIETGTMLPPTVSYKIYNLQGSLVDQGALHPGEYKYDFQLPVHRLSKGLYQLFIITSPNTRPLSFRFVRD